MSVSQIRLEYFQKIYSVHVISVVVIPYHHKDQNIHVHVRCTGLVLCHEYPHVEKGCVTVSPSHNRHTGTFSSPLCL